MSNKQSKSRKQSSCTRYKADWRDSRGSFRYGYWQDGKFTGYRQQVPATPAEMAANPSFILQGNDPEFVVDEEPDYTPYRWFTPVNDETASVVWGLQPN